MDIPETRGMAQVSEDCYNSIGPRAIIAGVVKETVEKALSGGDLAYEGKEDFHDECTVLLTVKATCVRAYNGYTSVEAAVSGVMTKDR